MQGKENAWKENAGKGKCREYKMQEKEYAGEGKCRERKMHGQEKAWKEKCRESKMQVKKLSFFFEFAFALDTI